MDVDCPQLFSKGAMKDYDVDLCFGEQLMKLHKFKVDLPFSSAGVPMINIFDFTEEDLQREWPKIPMYFKIEEYPQDLTPKPTRAKTKPKKTVRIYKKIPP